jgi:hypothetical protein
MNLQFLIVHKENYYGVGPGSELGDDAGCREELLGVPPVREPWHVVGHVDGPLVLWGLHVPGGP